MEKQLVRWHYRLTGQVQGVGLRYRAHYAAQALGLTGWVENQWDGSVELEVQGAPQQVEQLLERVALGRWVNITGLKRWALPPDPAERGFSIRE